TSAASTPTTDSVPVCIARWRCAYRAYFFLPLPLYVDLRLIIQILPLWVILNHVMLPVSFPCALNTLITAD
ncbi:hypothetical protein FCI58_20880, partial [Enterobacter hormaechei]|nr:hypothetical protein [Enterobacter hormaechei]